MSGILILYCSLKYTKLINFNKLVVELARYIFCYIELTRHHD